MVSIRFCKLIDSKLPVIWYFCQLPLYHVYMWQYNKAKGNKIVLTQKSKVLNNKVSRELFDMEILRNKIPDAALNYKDFQEPLIALND